MSDLAAGCYGAAVQYDRGMGVAVDGARAVLLYEKACDAAWGGQSMGHADACVRLAAMYTRGEGVRKDAAVAMSFLAKACSRGRRDACRALGR